MKAVFSTDFRTPGLVNMDMKDLHAITKNSEDIHVAIMEGMDMRKVAGDISSAVGSMKPKPGFMLVQIRAGKSTKTDEMKHIGGIIAAMLPPDATILWGISVSRTRKISALLLGGVKAGKGKRKAGKKKG